MMNKKRLIITSIISIILVSILFIGSTYSIFTSSDVDENLNVYKTGELIITSTSNNIKLENVIPTSKDEAISITPTRITIKNTGTVPYMLNLILADTTAGEVINYQYLYTQVGQIEPKLLNDCTSTSVPVNDTTYNGRIIKNDVVVPANSTVNIDVRVWIADTVKNTEIGKSFYGRLVVDGKAIYDYNEQIDNSILENPVILLSEVEPGSYVSLTPSKASYTTDTTYTGYNETQTINPQELNIWRVISLNDDGTVDVISEYVSSVDIYFSGLTGFKNFIGYLNILASQYENNTYTTGSRYFGYNGQTEYITDTSLFTTTAPWNSSTGNGTEESHGGGDTLYENDYNLVKTVLGSSVATNPNEERASYWLSSRLYSYSSSTEFVWSSRGIEKDGELLSITMYLYSNSSLISHSFSNALRPILTLKSNLRLTGEGSKNSPYQLLT